MQEILVSVNGRRGAQKGSAHGVPVIDIAPSGNVRIEVTSDRPYNDIAQLFLAPDDAIELAHNLITTVNLAAQQEGV